MNKSKRGMPGLKKMDTERNISAFLNVLNPLDNLTGGGTASAVAGAMAVSLVAMVARLSTGKKGMKDKAYYEAIDGEAQVLAAELFGGGHKDSEAFQAVRRAYRQTVDDTKSRTSRGAEIQRAVIQATRVPLENAEACKRVLELWGRLEGHSNPNAASDLICAYHLARAGLLGCLENVEINLGSIKDREERRKLGERFRALRRYAKQRDDQTNT
jgi:formiminotetrahydrofolate cyclodeaminase